MFTVLNSDSLMDKQLDNQAGDPNYIPGLPLPLGFFKTTVDVPTHKIYIINSSPKEG